MEKEMTNIKLTITNSTTERATTIKTTKRRFDFNYLDNDQREKILNHLKAGKTLKCHHKNCY